MVRIEGSDLAVVRRRDEEAEPNQGESEDNLADETKVRHTRGLPRCPCDAGHADGSGSRMPSRTRSSGQSTAELPSIQVSTSPSTQAEPSQVSSRIESSESLTIREITPETGSQAGEITTRSTTGALMGTSFHHRFHRVGDRRKDKRKEPPATRYHGPPARTSRPCGGEGLSMRTFQSEASRLEEACLCGEILPAMLSNALRWSLYMTRKRDRVHGAPRRPPVFGGGTDEPHIR